MFGLEDEMFTVPQIGLSNQKDNYAKLDTPKGYLASPHNQQASKQREVLFSRQFSNIYNPDELKPQPQPSFYSDQKENDSNLVGMSR